MVDNNYVGFIRSQILSVSYFNLYTKQVSHMYHSPYNEPINKGNIMSKQKQVPN